MLRANLTRTSGESFAIDPANAVGLQLSGTGEMRGGLTSRPRLLVRPPLHSPQKVPAKAQNRCLLRPELMPIAYHGDRCQCFSR